MLGKAGVVEDQDAVALGGQAEQVLDALPVEVVLVPVNGRQKALEALLGGPRDDLGDGVAVLVGVLGEQPSEVAFQCPGALAPVEVDTEGGEELGQLGQWSARGVWDSSRFHALTGLSQEGGFPGGSLWTISLEMCSIVGELTPIGIDGGSPMSTITQRIASAFVVLCGRYGDVTKMAHDREQSRQSLYREASQVANAVDGTAVQSRIDELQRQLAGQQAQIQDLQERLEHAIEITRDKQDEFASVAQAEGVSLSVARRLLQVVAGSVTTPSVPTLGRATEEAGQRAGQLLEVLDEVAQPKVKQATADEIFLGPNRS